MWLLAGLIVAIVLVAAIVCGLYLMSRRGKKGMASIDINVADMTRGNEARGSISAASRPTLASRDGRTIFVSYAHEDSAVADAIVRALEREHISCWIAPRDVPVGVNFSHSITDAIDNASIFVLVFSSHSNNSRHVQNEVMVAFRRGIPIIPFRIETVPMNVGMEYYIGHMHYIDAMTPPLQQHIDGLSDTIRILAKHPESRFEKPPAAIKVEKEPPRTKYVPAGNADNVHFTVTAPKDVLPGEWFVMDVWAHFLVQLKEVIDQAREEYKSVESAAEVSHRSIGPVQVGQGTVLTVRLEVETAEVKRAEGTIYWAGMIGRTGFRVKFPADVKKGAYPGLATIYVEGFEIAVLDFMIAVGEHRDEEKLDVGIRRHKKAFVSYASQDREKVLYAIQGLQKGCPQMEIFMDVLSLRSGQFWEQELRKVIPVNDVFYLFWSANARQSEWVEKEWRCALEARGVDFIDPWPLQSPDQVPPPQELAGKHFNDWTLAFMRQKATES